MADMAIYDIEFENAAGKKMRLAEYKGKLVLIVNVASKCGYTPQYEGLEKLYKKYQSKGLEILGFPCNQFGGQEPGTNKEIQNFCKLNYGVTFPVMAKVDVNGKNQSPLFEYLKKNAPGLLGTEAIKWNFTKFLISREGKVLQRFAPKDTPEDLIPAIEENL